MVLLISVVNVVKLDICNMTRLEVLKWCFDNISQPDNDCSLDYILASIGSYYYEELELMGFIFSETNWETRRFCAQLTDLGKAYCEEIFN